MSDYHLSNYINSFNSKKSFDEVLEAEKGYKIDDNIYNNCYMCDDKVIDLYHWYYLKNNVDDSKSIVICSIECLEEFREECDNVDEFEIIEYTRCSAYYKCLAIGNLRNMCERKEVLTADMLSKTFVNNNFCEPGQAGVVLSTYEIHNILDQFSRESNKQFKITTWMTILVIILTALNIIPIITGLFNNNSDSQVDMINASITQVNNKLENLESSVNSITNTQSNNLDEIVSLIKKEIKITEEQVNKLNQTKENDNTNKNQINN